MSTPRVRRPPGLVPLAAVGLALVALPLVALVGSVAWSELWADVTTAEAREALRLSLVCSLSAAVLAALLGLPLAWVLARVPFRGRSVVRALVLVPLVLPPVVGGVALLEAFSRDGLVGGPLYDWFGIQFTFAWTGVVLAETFVALPFFVLTVEGALRASDQRYEEVARTLGARPWATLRRVTLPAVRPALLAGAVLAWARALGEFGATITFAGNIAGRTRTLPLAVYLELQGDRQAAVALSMVLLAVALAVLVALRDRWLRTS